MSRKLFKAVASISLMTFISRILGFVRDLIAANVFGATSAVDAFYIAFKIPNFMRNLFAEGAFSQAFIPVLTHLQQTKDKAEVQIFVRHMAGLLSSVLLMVTIAGVAFAPVLVHLFAPGLDPYRFHLAVEMLRITFPYLMLISLTAMSGAILNCYGIFVIPALTPAFLNICLIFSAFGVTRYLSVPVKAQAWGVFIAGIVQFCFQLPWLHRIGFLQLPKLNWRDNQVSQVLKRMLHALFGASMSQLSILLNTIIASFLAVGSVSWLYYSERLAYFPLGVFGVALATVILPRLSRLNAVQSQNTISDTIDWGLSCNLLIGIPASLMMLFLSGPLVVTLFQHGKFNIHDVFMTQRCVMAYALGLQAFMLIKTLSSVFYAKHDVKTPVKITSFSLVLNMIFSVLLMHPLAHVGLALASSLSSWMNVTIMLVILSRRGIYQLKRKWFKFLFQLVVANTVLSVFLIWSAGNIDKWIAWGSKARCYNLLWIMIASMILYLVSLWLCRLRLHHLKINDEPINPAVNQTIS